MAAPEPFRPGATYPPHLHILRRLCLALLLPVVLLAGPGAALLWALSRGPVDITFVSRLIEPVPVVAGSRPGHPAGALTWSRLYLHWQPTAGGVSAGLTLQARGLAIRRLDGTVAERAEQADAVLALAPLFHGIVAPRRLRLVHASIALRRRADGVIELDLPGQKHRGRGIPTEMDHLDALDARDVTLSLTGLPGGQDLRIGPIDTAGRRGPVARGAHDLQWSGSWSSRLRFGALDTTVIARSLPPSDGTSRWDVTVAPFAPSALATLSPLAAKWAVPVSVEALIALRAKGGIGYLSTAELRVTLGAGKVSQSAGPPIDLRGGAGRVTLAMARPGLSGAVGVALSDARLTVADEKGALTNLTARATGAIDDIAHPRRLDLEARAGVDALDFATLGSVWPVALVRGGRRWTVANITSGKVRGMWAHARLRSDSGPAGLRPIFAEGAVPGHDMTVNWLRPVPPATGIEARLGFDGPDALLITLARGAQRTADGTIAIPEGSVRIGDLYGAHQPGDIDLHLTGPLVAFNDLLSHPRLHLLSRHPLPFTDPSGAVDGRVHLSLPLSAHVRNEDMHVLAKAGFQDVHLGNVVLGRAVDGASGVVDVTENGLALKGDSLLSGIPVHVAVTEDFHPAVSGRPRRDIRATALLDPPSAARAQLVPGGLFSGHAALDAHYVQRAGGDADLDLALDLAQAGITVPIWTKPAGEAATAAAHLAFSASSITAIDGLQAHGATLAIAGRGMTTAGRLSGIELEGFRLGRSEGSAAIRLPVREGDPVAVSVRADPLDLAPLFDRAAREAVRRGQEEAARDAALAPRRGASHALKGLSWVIDLDAPRVYFSRERIASGVVSHLRLNGGRLASGRFAMRAPGNVRAVLGEEGGRQKLTLEIGDLGAMLLGLGLYDRISGGDAVLRGTFTPDGDGKSGLGLGLPPFAGELKIGPFAFLRPPLSLTAVSDLSPLHWADSHLDHFSVDRLTTGLDVKGRLLTIRDGQIGNQALGVTVEGPIDLRRATLDLRGTIVPMFGLNTLAGHVPAVGKLLSPEKGGGLLAATYSVKGTVGSPKLSVNPFSVLLPGVFRKIVQ